MPAHPGRDKSRLAWNEFLPLHWSGHHHLIRHLEQLPELISRWETNSPFPAYRPPSPHRMGRGTGFEWGWFDLGDLRAGLLFGSSCLALVQFNRHQRIQFHDDGCLWKKK